MGQPTVTSGVPRTVTAAALNKGGCHVAANWANMKPKHPDKKRESVQKKLGVGTRQGHTHLAVNQDCPLLIQQQFEAKLIVNKQLIKHQRDESYGNVLLGNMEGEKLRSNIAGSHQGEDRWFGILI